MKNSYLILILLLLLASKGESFAQSTSNKGTDFWIAYAGHIDGTTSRMTLFLSSDVSTSYEVKAGGFTIASGNITANVVTPVFINPTQWNVYIGSSDVKETNKGINVTTGDPISVYCIISNNARTGGTLVLPTSTLEQEYYVFSQQNKGNANNNPYSEFTVVGVKDGTTVEITPTQSNRNGTRAAGTSFKITLNKGDIYQYQAVNDLTGTHIKAVSGCTPFAVFSGNTWAAYCEEGNARNPNGGDNIYQQLFPVTAWGKNFVSAPFYNTLHGNTDVIKIIVSEDNTTVTVNGSTTNANGTSLSNPYSRGSVITFYSNQPNVIKASAPIAVAQYQTSQTCNASNSATASQGGAYLGDPEMTVLNPIEQTLKDITVYSRLNSVSGVNTNITKYFLNIIIKTTDVVGFTLDGAAITSQFKTISNSDYSYAVVDVTNSSDQHRLKASGGFVAIAYGYGQVESYAYLAGTDLKNLKSNIEVFGNGGTLASTNFCLGTDFNFVLRLPYLTDKITWNLNNGAKIAVVNTPSYTTVVEDGVTYYLYNYALPSSNFASSGNYILKALIQKPATAVCGADEEIATTFEVFSPAFTMPAQACMNTDVQFTDTSPTTGGNIKSWHWDFGDGQTADTQNPKHKYSTYGTKTVSLKVVTDIGCTLTTTKNIDISALPKSVFTAVGPFCINNTVKFNNESTYAYSNIASQSWDFGNGQTSKEKSPSTTYAAAGNYNVKLISVSSLGCADTLVKIITIYETPEISFADPGSCINDVAQFEGKAVKGNIVTWHWDFGDGTNDITQNTLQKPSHKYTATGTYKVLLTGISTEGCAAVFEKNITISGSNPVSLFEVKDNTKLCANVPVTFENKSSIGFGNITKIEWIFDYKAGSTNTVNITDNAPAYGKIYTYQYPNAAIKTDYKVVMRAYSGQICYTETAPVTVSVYPASIVKLKEVSPVCEAANPFQLEATEENGVPGVGIFSGTGVTPGGLFSPRTSGPGNFNIKYTYTTNNGCIEEKNVNIKVDKLPVITMPEAIDILLGGKKEIATTATGSGLKYKWFPSDGLSSDSVLNPIAKPDKTTTYTLTVTSGTCTTVASLKVTVHENPVIPNVFSPNGDGKNDTWAIKYLETFSEGTITVFNRYGQKVFFASPYNVPWDGKFNGADVPVGVYYYIIEPNNGRKKYTGSVTLLR